MCLDVESSIEKTRLSAACQRENCKTFDKLCHVLKVEGHSESALEQLEEQTQRVNICLHALFLQGH